MDETYNSYVNSLPADYTGLKLILFIGGMFVILFLINLFLRKVLGIEKRNFLKAQYVNDRHRKVEFWLSMTGVAGVVAATVYGYGNGAFFPIYATLISGLIITAYRVYMEKKFAEHPKEYLFTILEFSLMILFILSLGSYLFPDIPLY